MDDARAVARALGAGLFRSCRRLGVALLALGAGLAAAPSVVAEAQEETAAASTTDSSSADETPAAEASDPAPAPSDGAASDGAVSDGAPAPAGSTPSGDAPAEASAEAPQAATPAPPASRASAASRRGPKRARRLEPLPAPGAEQAGALEAFSREAAEYETAARAYQSTLTLLVRHHYEEQRRRILEVLDQNVKHEQEQLGTLRDDAIGRLETFVARYSGANADPSATPDAMFRLAALYEERARGDRGRDIAEGLKPAIALYRNIIDQFPAYEELAGVAYYLGHAYTDAGQLDEGQQAWRFLVCHNRYPALPDPKDPGKLVVQALPQDHDPVFWNNWYNHHPIPFDQLGPAQREARKAPELAGEELLFEDPYRGCEPVPQVVPPAQEPRYLAEAWWQVGNYHFDQLDAGGPYSNNRAMSAYQYSMQYRRPPVYGVALYKSAWTSFKQQRFHAAVKGFVDLLRYSDRQEAETGEVGTDLRGEACTYIGSALTYFDFEGPPGEDPSISRSDVLDVEMDPLVAEEKMSVAITRVQDPRIVPQEEKWTPEIYKALGQEFIDVLQHRNAVAVLELTLARFPLDRDAPKLQDRVAALYEQLGRLAPDGSAVRTEYVQRALEARTMLAAYVGDTEWTQHNRDDHEAIDQAETLARRGLQSAAIEHTNQARAAVGEAQAASDADEQRRALERAIAEYRLADTAWSAYIDQDPAALDSYESRFWLADARYWGVVLQVTRGLVPPEADVEAARDAAIDVRDSTEDDRYLQPAAYYLVSMSDQLLKAAHREYADSSGARGVAPRDELQFDGTGAERRALSQDLPPEVENAVFDRDGYNESIAFENDPQKNGPLYAFQAADYYFVYGQFEEARRRFEAMMAENCGKNEWGYKAWEKLISMSNFEANAARSRALAESTSCAYDEASKRAEEALRKPVRQGVAYLEAREIYDAAENMPDGSNRGEKWRAAAAAYKSALDAAPDRDEAPEAAMNGAYAYKQVGEYDKAIEMYELFIARYGSDEKLAAVRDGDPNAEPPVPPAPEKYADRVKYLKMAEDALASSYVQFFDYPRAAATFDQISRTGYFPEEERREAARQALTLSASLGDEAGMRRARQNLSSLAASPHDLAEADFVIASSALKAYDPQSPARGTNEAARQAAEASMRAYYDANARNPNAAEFLVEAAYWVAKTKRAGRDPREKEWWQTTRQAFDTFRNGAPVKPDGSSSALGSRQAAFAAEAVYLPLDDDISRNFDSDAGHQGYVGTSAEVLSQYRSAAARAKQYYDGLQHVVEDYAAPEWATAAIARQGSLYDSLRTGLYDVRPPALKMFDAKTEALLQRAENSDSPELQEQADAVRMRVETGWRESRDRELDSADQVMVDRYGNAIALARRYNVSNPAVVKAIQRLAFFTDVIGEAKLGQYTGRVPSLEYTPGMFLRLRPGLLGAPRAESSVPPAPPPMP